MHVAGCKNSGSGGTELLIWRRLFDTLVRWEKCMMNLIRYLLVVLVALPQGFCCLTMGCKFEEKRSVLIALPSPVCCACCHNASESIHTRSNNAGTNRGPASKTCECRCRFQISDPRSSFAYSLPLIGGLVGVTSDEFNPCPIREPNTARDVSTHLPIRLQILYCVWRC